MKKYTDLMKQLQSYKSVGKKDKKLKIDNPLGGKGYPYNESVELDEAKIKPLIFRFQTAKKASAFSYDVRSELGTRAELFNTKDVRVYPTKKGLNIFINKHKAKLISGNADTILKESFMDESVELDEKIEPHIDKFLDIVLKGVSGKKAIKQYKDKSYDDIKKALGLRTKVSRFRDGRLKRVWIDFLDKDSSIQIKHSITKPKELEKLEESVELYEAKKTYKVQDGIGKAKYTVSFHDGKKKHKDGSPFYDIKIFKTKTVQRVFIQQLIKKGYSETSGLVKRTESVELDEGANKPNGFRISKVGTSKIKTGFGAAIEIPMGMKNIGITVNTEKDAIKWATKRYNIPKNIIKVKKIYHPSYDKEIQSQQADYHHKHRRGVRESVELDEATPKIKYAKIVKGLRDSQGPFSVVAIKNGKVVAQKNSIKNSKMLPIEVNDMADAHPSATISIESKDGKILNTFKESFIEEAPLNIASDGTKQGLGSEPPVKKKRKKFAGSEVFEITDDEYYKCVHGRQKHERWSRKFDMNQMENQEIRSYHHKNPSKSIIVQNSRTGEMSYLTRRMNESVELDEITDDTKIWAITSFGKVIFVGGEVSNKKAKDIADGLVNIFQKNSKNKKTDYKVVSTIEKKAQLSFKTGSKLQESNVHVDDNSPGQVMTKSIEQAKQIVRKKRKLSKKELDKLDDGPWGKSLTNKIMKALVKSKGNAKKAAEIYLKSEALKLGEGKYDSDPRIPKMSKKGKELLAWMANSFQETGGPYLDKNNVHSLTTYAIDRIMKKLNKLKNLPPDKKKDMALVKKELGEGVDWGKMYGYIATYKGKELRIKKNEADGIYAAKRFARRHFNISPAGYKKLTVEPAMKESVEYLDEAVKISWNDAKKGFRTELLRIVGEDIKNAYVLWNKIDKKIQRKIRGLASQKSNGDIYIGECLIEDNIIQKLLKKYKMDKPHKEKKKKEKERINRIRKYNKNVLGIT
jgi:hypothetical protein